MFHLDKNIKFELQYPSLEERKTKFISFVIGKLKNIDDRKKLTSYDITTSKKFMELRELNMVEKKRGLSGVKNPTDYNPSEIILTLEKISKEYCPFLCFLENLLINYLQIEEIKDDLLYIAKWINEFDLDYKWDFKNNELKRTLDEGNLSIIDSNIKNIKQDKDNFLIYQECLDDFLKIDNITKHQKQQSFFHDSLHKIKELFENILKKYDLRISNKKPIARKITNSNNNDYMIKTIEFIVKNIHHNQEGKRYPFSEKEYLYWWLEINKLIYLIEK
jgi:hypothetical protein